MNAEQQLWKDVQKFMNQFPGFITVAKKIGDIGDLETWQENEQRKLETLTQEVEKQRQAIKIERDAANAEAAKRFQELEASIEERDSRFQALESATRANCDSMIAGARKEADRILDVAATKAKEITDGVAMTEARKTELEQQIADLMDVMLATKNEHESIADALAATKDQHAAFIKQIIGTGG
jgi:DNA repair exonuclease SbcCD ATPase subunit